MALPSDPKEIQIIAAVVVSVLGILGTVLGWFGKGWQWVKGRFVRKAEIGVVDVPKRTLILIPVMRENALWWHMGAIVGASASEPAMQIVGDLNATNISNYDVLVTGVKLRKPRALGHAMVREHEGTLFSSKFLIPKGAIGDLRFNFFVCPPVRTSGKTFKADLAIVDQFGNEHWLKKLEFRYAQ